MSNDPIGLRGGDFNLRRYVGNSPTNAVDPSGLYYTFSGWSGAPGPGGSFTFGFSFDPDSCMWYLTTGGGLTTGGITFHSESAGNISNGTTIDIHGTVGNGPGGITVHADIAGQTGYISGDVGYKVPGGGADVIGNTFLGMDENCWEEKLKKAKKKKPKKPHMDFKYPSYPLKVPGVRRVDTW